MMVMMDVMHNYAAMSRRDGMSLYDGGEGCCFYRGRRGSENYARNFDFTKYFINNRHVCNNQILYELRILAAAKRYLLKNLCKFGAVRCISVDLHFFICGITS